MVTNRKLQAAIQVFNKFVADETEFAGDNGYHIAVLAIALEDAFRPAARILESYQKEAQSQVAELVKPFDGDQEKFNSDSVAVDTMNELNAEYTAKVERLMDIEVSITAQPITLSMFRLGNGVMVDIPFRSSIALSPFIKG